jgi:hypothetical protein
MADLPNLPLVFDRRKIETSLREAGQFTFFNLTSTDDNAVATGSGQSTAYQIRAANTYFSSVPVGTGCVLPQTSGPTPLDGLLIYVTNGDSTNSLLCYPHPNDPSNSINQLAINAPVVLGPRSITPFIAFNSLSESTAGKWVADGIGAGAAGSIETIISQGNVASAGTTAATATQITQGMVSVTSGGASPAGVTLPFAQAGMQIALNNTNGSTITVYAQTANNPLTGSADTVNGAATTTQTSSAGGIVVIYFSFVNGAWTTK